MNLQHRKYNTLLKFKKEKKIIINIQETKHEQPLASSSPPIQTCFLHSPDPRRKGALGNDSLCPVTSVATFSQAALFHGVQALGLSTHKPAEPSSPRLTSQGLQGEEGQSRIKVEEEEVAFGINRLKCPPEISSSFLPLSHLRFRQKCSWKQTYCSE